MPKFRNAMMTLALAASALTTLVGATGASAQERMTRRSATPPLFAAPASGATAPAADVDRNVKPALESANLWLGLTDINRAQQSWEQAAPAFQRTIQAEDWARALNAARVPLGKLGKRKVDEAVFTRAMPGQPDGEYVVIKYNTTFEHKAQAEETVTVAHGIDGRWRVAGYVIR